MMTNNIVNSDGAIAMQTTVPPCYYSRYSVFYVYAAYCTQSSTVATAAAAAVAVVPPQDAR